MKAIVVVLLVSVLLAMSSFAKAGCLCAQGFSRGGAYRGSNSGTYGYGGSTGQTYQSNYSSARPTYGVTFTSGGKEIEGASARSQWLWIDGPSHADLDRQKARDDAFRVALEEYQKTFPFRLTP
jgi:hypothetical protein